MIAIAQPTITRANFVPGTGDTQLYYIADTNSVLDNSIGANVVFNYNALRGYGQSQTQYFIDPSTTANSGDFPTATITDTTDSLAGNLRYNEDFTDSICTIGVVLDINNIGAAMIKYDNNPESFMKFPFNYGDSYSDSYSGVFSSPLIALTSTATGTVTVTADAWGTLKLPIIADIDSVIRVVRVENLLTDTIFLQPFFPDILPIPINAVQVSYYKPSLSKNPLLSFVTGDINGDTSINVISQYPLYGVGIEEVNQNITISLSPNPTNNNRTLLAFTLKNKAMVDVTIFNHVGQIVMKAFNGRLPQGKNKLNVNTSALRSGIYYININLDNKVVTKKLIIN